MTDEQRPEVASDEVTFAAREDLFDDEATVVRPRGEELPPSEKFSSSDELSLSEDEESDLTVVRVSPAAADLPIAAEPEEDTDATVVRTTLVDSDEGDEVDDATVVRTVLVDADEADDADDADEADDATIVRADPTPTATKPDRRGDPVPDPEPLAVGTEQSVAPQGISAQEAAAGGTTAATARSGMLRRAVNLMPRVYGPRKVATTVAPEPVVTAAGGVAAANPRAQLPSLERRDRRARLITLTGYAISVCIAGVGLWFVATLALAG